MELKDFIEQFAVLFDDTEVTEFQSGIKFKEFGRMVFITSLICDCYASCN